MRIALGELQYDFSIPTILKRVFGQNLILWNAQEKPIYDLIDEYHPDIIITDIKQVSETFVEAMNEHPEVKLVLFSQGVPEGLKPEIVCANASTPGIIRKHIDASANQVIYQKEWAKISQRIEDDHYTTRKVGHIARKAEIELYRARLEQMGAVKQTKSIVGLRVPSEFYLGNIARTDYLSYIWSNDIYADFDSMFLLEGAALGKYVVYPEPNLLFSLFSTDNLDEKCNNILRDSKYKKEAKEAQKKVWAADTCYHRTIEILEALGLPEVERAKELLKEKKKCVSVS